MDKRRPRHPHVSSPPLSPGQSDDDSRALRIEDYQQWFSCQRDCGDSCDFPCKDRPLL